MDFKQPYDRNRFRSFLHRFLTDKFTWKLEQLPIDVYIRSENRKILDGYILGHDENLELTVYEFLHDSERDPRVTLSKEAFTIMSNRGDYRALAVFRSNKSANYRLSLLTIDLTVDEKGLKKKFSNPRRYSFFLGPEAKVGTPSRMLRERVKDFEDLRKRFSIEVVNKEFYKAIADHFTRLVGTPDQEGLLKLPGDHQKGYEDRRIFAIRLIGRIIFLWFLKQKKSLEGLPLIPEELLSRQAVKEDYYHFVLEPLFFEILNKPLEKRLPKYRKPPYDTIPFLNGGLFTPKDSDFYYLNNATELSEYLNILKIPDEWFDSLFEVLETYNFTIDENTPIDIELSVDPEMLGKIFENLLAELNPETSENARKMTGSYYTPREIVDFMVDESLKRYLMEELKISEEDAEKILSYTEDIDLPLDRRREIVDKIRKIKVLDPACGSGAFLMGMLQKLVWVLGKVDPDASILKEMILEDISDPLLRKMMNEKLNRETLEYLRKLMVIENSIYGVDIQEIAIELAKLRVFLSLIVDANVDDKRENRGIEPLPNLDFKLVCADTLFKLYNKTVPLSEVSQNKIEELAKIIEEYFTASTLEEKKGLQERFRKLQDEIFKGISQWIIAHGSTGSTEYKLISWDPFGDRPANWFDPFWMFGVKDGFDIVISNPPYIQLQKNQGKLAKQYKDAGYKTFDRMGDIYVLFYERGLELLKEGGILTYITSNKWMRSGYGKKLREYLLKYYPVVLIDLGPGVFESATVDTCILVVQKKSGKGRVKLKALKLYDRRERIADKLKREAVEIEKLSSGPWYIGSPDEFKIKEKIEKVGKPLKDWMRDWNVKIFYGIKTGLNEAFIIDEKTKEMVLNNCKDEDERKRTEEIIKPVVRGEDIGRYLCDWKNQYIIVIPAGWTNKMIKKMNTAVDPETFIASYYYSIYHHLKKIGDAIRNGKLKVKGKGLYSRYDMGDYWWELRPCDYYDEFEKEKIVWGNISYHSNFALVGKEFYVSAPANILTASNIDIRYLLGVMNSKIFEWEFRQVGIFLGKGFEWKKQYVEQIHIPVINESNRKKYEDIIELVQLIVSRKSKDPEDDTTQLELEIDQLVYELYGLNDREIKIIEEALKKEENEAQS